MEDYQIGDSVESLNFQDRIDAKQRLRIEYSTDNDYGAWLLTKQQTIQLRDWLNNLIEKGNWNEK